MSARALYHITTADEARAARRAGTYISRGFAREGFVHCSYGHQVAATAARLFAGRSDLVLLEIDAGRLSCRVVDENLEGGAELFPHVYGSIPMDAVTRVLPFRSDAAGRFDAPDHVA